jgi:hypothetical protein
MSGEVQRMSAEPPKRATAATIEAVLSTAFSTMASGLSIATTSTKVSARCRSLPLVASLRRERSGDRSPFLIRPHRFLSGADKPATNSASNESQAWSRE